VATVIVSNLGKETLMIRTKGLIRVFASGSEPIDLDLGEMVVGQFDDSAVKTIAGGGTERMQFTTRLTADEISTKHFKGSLQAVYSSEVLSCRFALLRVMATGEDSAIGPPQMISFGGDVRGTGLARLKEYFQVRANKAR
jgi:hypothetical protein